MYSFALIVSHCTTYLDTYNINVYEVLFCLCVCVCVHKYEANRIDDVTRDVVIIHNLRA